MHSELLDYFNCSFARYVKIESKNFFTFKDNNVRFVRILKHSSIHMIYSIIIFWLLQKRPVFESKWQKTFEFDNKYLWKNKYVSKMMYMYEKILPSLININF